jgi:cation diffusion facilitator family transporter
MDRASHITLVGAAVDLVLGVGKIAVGAMAQSHALVADGIHSLTDLVTDAGVLVVARVSRANPDDDHPYGHARFETLASLALGALLLIVAGALAQDSLSRLVAGTTVIPGALALAAAGASIVAKEWVFRATRRVAEEIGSPLLHANAWHSRSDALSSVAVLVGVLGAMAGWPWCDLLASLVVAGLIGWVGGDLIFGAARELVDTGVPTAEQEAMAATVRAVPGVLGVHQLRSRRMGPDVLLDVDLEVEGTLSVSEGHRIATAAAGRLRAAFPDIGGVNVHVDPLHGQVPGAKTATPSEAPGPEPRDEAADDRLPEKADAEAALRAALTPALRALVERVTLHYDREAIDVELFLTAPPDGPGQRTLAEQLREGDIAWLGTLRVWLAHAAPAEDEVRSAAADRPDAGPLSP